MVLWAGVLPAFSITVRCPKRSPVRSRCLPMADVTPFPAQRQPGLVRTVSNAEMMAAERRQIEEQRAAQADTMQFIGLAGYIRQQWDMMVRHRNTVNGWSDRLLSSLRCIQGQYEPSKLAEIRRFGGSEVYARLIAAKVR